MSYMDDMCDTGDIAYMSDMTPVGDINNMLTG